MKRITLKYRSCFECGSQDHLHDHHVVPRSRGGTKTLPLCERCHARAHGRSGDFTTSDLTSDALRRKRALGEYTGGTVPFGFRVGKDGASLVEDKSEQKIITMIHHHRGSGLSLRETARLLNKKKVTRRNGNDWHHMAVRRIEDSAQRRKAHRGNLSLFGGSQ